MLTVEAESRDRTFSPFHMLGSALGICVHDLLVSWAQTAKFEAGPLAVDVSWTFAPDPHRVGAYRVLLDWKGLPENRRSAALRAAAQCPVHATLHAPPSIALEHA